MADRRYFRIELTEKIDKRKKRGEDKLPLKVIGLVSAETKGDALEKCTKEYPNYVVASVEEFTEAVEDVKPETKKARKKGD